jgi:ribulose bisphosphate carboxylase small subunit
MIAAKGAKITKISASSDATFLCFLWLWYNGKTRGKGNPMMEEVKLSAEAQREQAALATTNERMRLEGIEMDAKIQALEEIVRRKQDIIRRQEEFLAAIEAERKAVDEDYQRVRAMNPVR